MKFNSLDVEPINSLLFILWLMFIEPSLSVENLISSTKEESILYSCFLIIIVYIAVRYGSPKAVACALGHGLTAHVRS